MRRPNIETLAGLGIIATIVAATSIASFVTKYGPTEVDQESILTGPSWNHPFGTDELGMDVFARVLYAPRIDLTIAFTATVLAMITGITLGTLAGAYEGTGLARSGVAHLIMRSMDVLQAIPVFVFALVVVAVLGSGSTNVILALGFVTAPVFIRLVRGEMLVWREHSFVEAATLAGWNRQRIAFRHVLPNAVTPASAQGSVVLGYCILLTAGLSFVGAGVRPPTAEWGVMIAAGAEYLASGAWWTTIFPGLAIGVTVFGFALLGEGLRKSFTEARIRIRFGSRWAANAFE
jgi:peptide/nickel transport system permease protein